MLSALMHMVVFSKNVTWTLLLVTVAVFHAPVAAAFDNASVWTLIHENRCPGCDLSGASLRARDFPDAKLQGADLSGADLRFVDFSGADLRGASLLGSDLTGANLTGARIDAANFQGVVYCQTRMPDGLERMDECLEGTWNENQGAVMLIQRRKNGTFKAILASGAQEHVGSVLMRNLKRAGPGVYTGEQLVIIEDERMWIGTECIVAGPQMQCFDGMMVFQRASSVAVRPGKARFIRTFEYQPSVDIGAPTNREGPGSR